jgi:hypothetical protein
MVSASAGEECDGAEDWHECDEDKDWLPREAIHEITGQQWKKEAAESTRDPGESGGAPD